MAPTPPRRNPPWPVLTLCVVLACGAMVAATVAASAWLLGRLHTDGARKFCLAWSARVREQIDATEPAPQLASAMHTLRMQSEYYDYQLETAGTRAATLARLRQGLRRTLSDLEQVAKGVDPFSQRTGNVLRAFPSPVDGTLQPYSLSVPEVHARGRPLPLLIHLHGHGWFGPFQGHPAPKLPVALVLSPHGRGSTDYMMLGEQDVLAALDHVQQHYRVDADGVYLAGASMGGTGSWHMAVHYPDRFAGIGPVNGNADHHVWEQLWGWNYRTTGTFARLRRFVADGISPISFAENLVNVPVYCIHSGADEVVPVQHARNMVARVRDAGGMVAYREVPEATHGETPPDLRTEQLVWLGRHRRTALPRRVVYRTHRRRYAGAYWVRILDFRRELAFARVEAEVLRPGRVRVRTSNVQTLALQLPAALVGPCTTVSVTIDDGPAHTCTPHSTQPHWFSFDADQGLWTRGQRFTGKKTAAVEGPFQHVFSTPFVVVYGTQSHDPIENRVLRDEAQRFARQWAKRYGKPCRITADEDLDAHSAGLLSLVLYGGPWANRWTAKLMPELPLTVTPEAVTFGHERCEGPDVGVKLCFPSPLNANRYVALIAATTWRGIWQSNGRFGNWFDWGAYDNHNWFDFAVFDAKTWSPETFRVVGFFDRNWQTRPGLTWTGVPALRELRHPFAAPRAKPAPDPKSAYLSDLLPTDIDQDRGQVTFDLAWDGRPITLEGQSYPKGLGIKAPSALDFDLGRRFKHFRSVVAIDYGGPETLSSYRLDAEWLEFNVYGDGRLLATSGPLYIGRPIAQLAADVTGVRRLTLQAWCLTGARWLIGSAVWAGAQVSAEPIPLIPTPIRDEPDPWDPTDLPGSEMYLDEGAEPE